MSRIDNYDNRNHPSYLNNPTYMEERVFCLGVSGRIGRIRLHPGKGFTIGQMVKKVSGRDGVEFVAAPTVAGGPEI